jgi:hypothetical protein
VLGILSLVFTCFPLGIVAWVMGNSDIREIDAGRMDHEGRGLALAGKICGIISCVISAISILFILAIAVIVPLIAASANH